MGLIHILQNVYKFLTHIGIICELWTKLTVVLFDVIRFRRKLIIGWNFLTWRYYSCSDVFTEQTNRRTSPLKFEFKLIERWPKNEFSLVKYLFETLLIKYFNKFTLKYLHLCSEDHALKHMYMGAHFLWQLMRYEWYPIWKKEARH